MQDKDTKIISFKVSKKLLNDFDELAKSKGYQIRGDAIKDLMKLEIKRNK
ncbi:MAG: ribbon-helix-helix domain-containing protein [Methanobacteriaceae archaeon]|nr:ribbon-helix-helix domain-containing protein [Methanobacteriaceae archaeon]